MRELLRRMNIEIVEIPENHEHTKFCGISLYQPQPARNPKLAPKRFLEGAKGLFQEHTQEEKKRLMEQHVYIWLIRMRGEHVNLSLDGLFDIVKEYYGNEPYYPEVVATLKGILQEDGRKG